MLYCICQKSRKNDIDTVTLSLCCRMVREVSYREFQKHHNIDPEPLAISYKAYKVSSFIKCPLCWTQGAIEAIHEGAESYMINLLEDAYLLAIHARRITVQPWDIQLA